TTILKSLKGFGPGPVKPTKDAKRRSITTRGGRPGADTAWGQRHVRVRLPANVGNCVAAAREIDGGGRPSTEMARRRRRIDPEDAALPGEETELLQSETHAALVGMAVDVSIELRDGEGSVDDVALELGDVDPISSEAAQRLVESRRHASHAK